MYCILRTKKIKDRNNINKAIEHNFRLRTQANINSSKTQNNKLIFNSLNANINEISDFQKKLTEYYGSLNIKEKKSNVLLLEFVVSASPEFFSDSNKSNAEIEKWAKTQLEFFQEEFGTQLKMGVLHLDEKTPHIHFFVGTEQKTIKKYKNQRGEFFKETNSLNAKRYDPKYLIGLHDRFAIKNSIFGLKRGQKGSKKMHKPVKEYYKELEKQKELVLKEAEDLVKLKKFKDAYPILKENILNNHKMIYELFDILENKELTEQEIKRIEEISNSLPKINSQKKKTKFN